jgi:hypothetical protein
MKVRAVALFSMILELLLAGLLTALHSGHKHEIPIRIKLYFSYQPISETNSYEIHVDGNLLQQFRLIDSNNPLRSFEDTMIDVKKGHHVIKVLLKETDSFLEISKNFAENEEFTIYFDGNLKSK